MVQGKYDTWRLPCSPRGLRICARYSVAPSCLSSTDSLDGWDSAAILLDRGYPRPSSPTEFRAHFLFCVFGAGLLFRMFTLSTQRPALLHKHPSDAGDFCLDDSLPGIVVFTVFAAPPAC